jgi:RHS repeat-associated protein
MNELTATYQQNTTGIPEAFRTTETGSEKSPGKINGCFFQGLDYYPFGSLMPGRNLNASDYRFGFNGKESDPEWTGNTGVTYDYGFRIYDARIAKFLSVDPLSANYPWYTPYQFAGNKPITCIDLDGLEEYNITLHPLYPTKPKLNEWLKQIEVAHDAHHARIHRITKELVAILNEMRPEVIEEGSEDYQFIYNIVDENVKTIIQLETKADDREELYYEVSDIDIEYKGESIKKEKDKKRKEVTTKIGKQVAAWGSRVLKIMKGIAPKIKDYSIMSFSLFFKFQETGASADPVEAEKSRKRLLKQDAIKQLDKYMNDLYKKEDTKSEIETPKEVEKP